MDLPPGLALRASQGARPYQEDDYGFLPLGDTPEKGVLLILADGMGGEVGGAVASGTAILNFLSAWQKQDGSLPVSERLKSALAEADRSLRLKFEETPELEGMGCTLVGAVVANGTIQWISVGDSPLWFLAQDGLRRLNEDHSMAPMLQNLVEAGRMTAEEAANDPRRNALRSAVMGKDPELVDVAPEPVSLVKPGRVVLASDGLQTLDDEEIEAIAKQSPDADSCADSLMKAVEEKKKPHQDNITVWVYDPPGAASVSAGAGVSDLEEETKAIRRKTGGGGGFDRRIKFYIAAFLISAAAAGYFLLRGEPQSEPEPAVNTEEKTVTDDSNPARTQPVREAVSGNSEESDTVPAGVEPGVEKEESPNSSQEPDKYMNSSGNFSQ